MIKRLLILFLALNTYANAQSKPIEACFKDAANKYNVPLNLLLAVSYTESRFKLKAHNINRNGTHDYGPMQINSVWSKQAKKMGYSWAKIKSNPCTNIMFGTRILKDNRQRMGSWSAAVGAYNAGFGKSPKAKKRRQRYYQLVMSHRTVAQHTIKKITQKST